MGNTHRAPADNVNTNTNTGQPFVLETIDENIDACVDVIQFKHRIVRAWRYDDKQLKWKGRGKGELSIYLNSTTQKAKLIFKDEKYDKIRLLQYIDGDTYAKKEDIDNIKNECVVWFASDYTMNHKIPLTGKWRLHFMDNKGITNQFIDIFNSFIDKTNDDNDIDIDIDINFMNDVDDEKQNVNIDRLGGYQNKELIMQVGDIGMDVLYYLLSNYLYIRDITMVSLTCTTMNEIIKICKPISPYEIVLIHEKLNYWNAKQTETCFDKYIQQNKRVKGGYISFKFNQNEFRFKNAHILQIENLSNGALTSSILGYFDRLKKITVNNDVYNQRNHHYFQYFDDITEQIASMRNVEYVQTVNMYYKFSLIRKLVTTNMYTMKYFECKNFKIDLLNKDNKHSLREYISMVKHNGKDYEYGYKAHNEWHHYINIKNDFKYLEKKYWLLNHSYVDVNYYVTEHNRLKSEYDEYIEKQRKLDRENTNLKLTLDKMEEINKCIICMKNKREYIMLYCGHFVLCGECIKHYKPQKNKQTKCPVCFTRIKSTVKVYQ